MTGTTTALCPCGQPVADASICRACTACRGADCYQDEARTKRPCLACCLDEIPRMRAQLNLTLSRQSVLERQDGGRSAEVPLPYHLGASDALELLGTVLRRIARPLALAGSIDVMATLLARRLDDIRQHQDASAHLISLGDAIAKGRRTVDLAPREFFAGPCDGHGVVPPGEAPEGCPGWLYSPADEDGKPARDATCKVCATDYDAGTRREWMLEAAEEYLAPPAVLSRFLRFKGEPVNASTLRTWRQRGRLEQKGTDREGNPLYLIGDVRKLVIELEIRRATRSSSNGH